MTQLTKTDLATQVTTLLADNTAGDISASDVRSVFTDVKDSLVGGPTSATDNAVARFDSTTGQLVQNSVVIVADTTGNMSGVGTLACGATTVTGALIVTADVTADGTVVFNNAAADKDFTVKKLTSGSALVYDAGADTLGFNSSLTTHTGPLTVTGNLTTSAYTAVSVANTLTAVGANRATALVLAKEVNNVTTAAASTGVVLPAGVVGMRLYVFNNGANPIQVYGNGSDTIDGVAGSTGVPLTNAKRAVFICVAANTFLSAQLGVVSA